MKRALGMVAAAVVLVLAGAAIWIWWQVTEFDVTRVTDDVYAIHGLGGNVGVLTTDQGAVVVDTMAFRAQGARILERAERLADRPVLAVVNTHYHSDHTHGNPAFPAGLPIHATERTLGYLKAVDADYWDGDAAGTLPNQTFRNETELRFADKTVRLIHPGRGHTDGDLVVLFVEDKVVHMGDLFFAGRYPNIDLEAGGSVGAWVSTIDRVLELDFESVIPDTAR